MRKDSTAGKHLTLSFFIAYRIDNPTVQSPRFLLLLSGRSATLPSCLQYQSRNLQSTHYRLSPRMRESVLTVFADGQRSQRFIIYLDDLRIELSR